MGTNLMRALLLTSASVAMVATAAPTAAYAQEATYQIDIPAQSMGDALRALGKATKQNIVFNGSLVKGKRSAAVRGRLSASDALERMLAGSGLKMSRGSGGGLVVQGGNGGAAPASGRQRPAAAQGQGRGTVTGTVKDEETGGALKGALVELVGTGRTTSTDELGAFRFPNVPAGDATIRISYLGYAEQQSTLVVASGETYAQDFTLIGGSAGQEIVVYGSRSARAQALNQERTAENNTTVLSSDLLGDFTGTTIAESLRRAPGVVFQRNQFTGDGSNITVRGLEPDMNAVKFNGVELPETTGAGRAASLGNILTESVNKVTISKTLLPNQDSAGTGGLVEIETKTPLDRARRYASVTLEGAKKQKGYGSEVLAAGTVSGKFGAEERFGVSASLQYRNKDNRRLTYGATPVFGQYLPLQVDGTPTVTSTDYIDPRTAFPFEEGVDEVYLSGLSVTESNTTSENLGLTLSAAWEMSPNSKIVFTYQKLKDDVEDTSGALRLASTLNYALQPVSSLGGQSRRVLGWRSPQNLSAQQNHFTSIEKTNTDVLSLQGDASAGKWNFKYAGGYTRGDFDRQSYSFSTRSLAIDPAFVTSEAIHPTEGRIISPFAQRFAGQRSFPELYVSDSGFATLNDPNRYLFGVGSNNAQAGSTERYSAEGSVRYQADSKFLKYIEIGASFKRSTFRSEFLGGANYFGRGETLGTFGLTSGNASLADSGIRFPVNLIDRRGAREFLLVGMEAAGCGSVNSAGCLFTELIPADERLAISFTREDEYIGYLQSSVAIGKLEIVGGVRLSHLKVTSNSVKDVMIYDENYFRDEAFYNANSGVIPERASQTVALPRLLANLRFNDNFLIRAGYYLSVARPRVDSITSRSGGSVNLLQAREFGPTGNLKYFEVIKGSPDIKPARTHSFDINAEYYDDNVGVMKLGAFYKRIDNLLELSVSNAPGDLEGVRSFLPSDPRIEDVFLNPQDYEIIISYPQNNAKPAHIWGIEASVEKQFTFLPGWLSGFGIYSNLTYTDSTKSQPRSWSFSPVRDANGIVTGYERITFDTRMAFNQQAKYSGTAGLTYNRFGIDANVAYTFQSKRKLRFDKFELDEFERAYGSLDARFEYRFREKLEGLRLFVEGSDLLRGPDSATLEKSLGGRYYTSGAYLGGRQIRLGASMSF